MLSKDVSLKFHYSLSYRFLHLFVSGILFTMAVLIGIAQYISGRVSPLFMIISILFIILSALMMYEFLPKRIKAIYENERWIFFNYSKKKENSFSFKEIVGVRKVYLPGVGFRPVFLEITTDRGVFSTPILYCGQKNIEDTFRDMKIYR